MGMTAAHCRRVATFGELHARQILIAALLVGLVTGSRAAILIGNTFDRQSIVRVPEDPLATSSDQLAKLRGAALALAGADDTSEFVSRPNLPYVSAHFTKQQLAADRIDTVLIINTRGEPLFWRRLNQSRNRGFPDAKAFLAGLPRLPAPGASGVPGIAAPTMLNSGPALVVAMPIHGANGKGRARGWLIVAKALDSIPGHAFGGLVQTQFYGSDPLDSTVSGSVVAARQLAGVAAPATFFTSWSTVGIGLLLIMSGIVVVKSGILIDLGKDADRLRVSVRPIGRAALSAPSGAAVRHEKILTLSSQNSPAPEPEGMSFSAGQVRDPLQARISAANAVFRYQPQIDLRTGQVAGVEALLCVHGLADYRPATELAADIEKAGLGLALFERRLQEACRWQRTWLRDVGHDFAIGVPVSRRILTSAPMLPIVQRVLAKYEIPPALLELEVEEAALGACSEPLRTLTKVHEAGISIALDGFNANHSNLRLLAILPIAKLRVDPWLLLRMTDRVSEEKMFAGILGAARGLGIGVCATGVASADMLAAVLQHGRPLAQGTAVAASLDGQEFLERLRGSNVDTVTVRPLDLNCAESPDDAALPVFCSDPIKVSGSRSRPFSVAASCT
jgi:EAL domain-containing protein (putative c-di-GMP-specific phosphodiesterase class I)